MKLTSPKDKEFTVVEKTISVIEDVLKKAPNGQSKYTVTLNQPIPQQECIIIVAKYKQVGWKEVVYNHQRPDVFDKKVHTIFKFTK